MMNIKTASLRDVNDDLDESVSDSFCYLFVIRYRLFRMNIHSDTKSAR